jgi:enoyl-[acyl-carrier protein] reductase I
MLDGKRGLVVGVANERSIAWGIARAARARGAELVLTYQNERLQRRVEPLANEVGAVALLPCDAASDQDVASVADQIGATWGRLDFLVHAVAYAERADLEGRFVDTSREGFATALDVSVYSLVALARATLPLFAGGGSIVTLSYGASRRAMPGYNVMGVAKAALESAVRYLAAELGPSGVRVNALSPGPIKTLSAAGVRGLRAMLAHVEANAPLRRNVDIDDVGRAAAFLLSDLSSGTTGEVIHVDSGYHALGVPWAEPGRTARSVGGDS